MFFSIALSAQKNNNAVLKGNELYKKGDFKNAQAEYEKALQEDGKNAAAQFNNGNALQKQGKFADAAKQFLSITESSKDSSMQFRSSYNKGVAEVKQKQLQEAVNSFKQSLRLNAKDEEARDNLQKALNELKKQDQQKPKDNQKPENKPKDKKPQSKMNKEQAENLLNQLRQEEKRMQERQKQKIKQVKPEKDW